MGKAANSHRSGPLHSRSPASCGRVHSRRIVHRTAQVGRADGAFQREAWVENVGLGGACLVLGELGERVRLDDVLIVSFTAPTAPPLCDRLVLRGRIVWASADEVTPRVGLAFDHESARSVLELCDFIVALASE